MVELSISVYKKIWLRLKCSHSHPSIAKILILMPADPECHTDYFLACLASEKEKYARLFDRVSKTTVILKLPLQSPPCFRFHPAPLKKEQENCHHIDHAYSYIHIHLCPEQDHQHKESDPCRNHCRIKAHIECASDGKLS